MTLEIRPLSGDAEIAAAYPLARQLRDRIREETFLAEVRRQAIQEYRLYGGYADGHLVVLAGVRRSHTLSRGEHLFVDDLVTAEEARGRGYGREMLEWLDRQAAADGIPKIYLDSRTTARGFYERLGYTFLTSIPCWKDTAFSG
jgi:GNAT superfamily N-acetyltransferase